MRETRADAWAAQDWLAFASRGLCNGGPDLPRLRPLAAESPHSKLISSSRGNRGQARRRTADNQEGAPAIPAEKPLRAVIGKAPLFRPLIGMNAETAVEAQAREARIGGYSFDEFCETVGRFHGYPAPGVLLGGFMVEEAKRRCPPDVLLDAECETSWRLPDSIQIQ